MIAGRNTDIQIILKDIAAQIKVHAAGQLLDYRLAGFQPYRRAIAADEIKIKAQFLRNDRIIYDIYEEVVEVYILEVEGHYNDK